MTGYATFHDLQASSVFITGGGSGIDATLFLASKTSRMMTSQAMVVDGGVVVTG